MDPRRRAEQDQARSLRILQLAMVPVVVAVAAVRFARDGVPPGWLVGGTCAVIVIVVVLTRRSNRVVSSFESRADLSEYISSARWWTRFNLAYLEYTIARNVARGSYEGERPSDFQAEADILGRRLINRTRFITRLYVGMTVVVSAGTAALVAWMHHDLPDTITIGAAMVIWLIPTAFGVYFTLLARGPVGQRSIARRIEGAMLMSTDERWQTLLDIARDELALKVDDAQLTSASS